MEPGVARLEICSLNTSRSTISVRVLGSDEQIVVSSSSDLVANCFEGLATLRFTNSWTLSTYSVVGLLAGNGESVHSMCGAIFPLVVLRDLCTRSLETSSIKTFLYLCSCFYDLQLLVQDKSSSTVDEPHRKSIQLPANKIWELLLLAEIFGAQRVFQQCRTKVLQFLVPEGGTIRKLPANIMSHISPEYCGEVQDRLASHFLRFGNAKDVASPHNSKPDGPSSDLVEHSPATSTASEQSLRSASTPAYLSASALVAREDVSDSRSLASWATDEDTVHEQHGAMSVWPSDETATRAVLERHVCPQPVPATVPIPVPVPLATPTASPPPAPLPPATPPSYLAPMPTTHRGTAVQASPSTRRPRRSVSPSLAFGRGQARSLSPALSRSVVSGEESVRRTLSTEELQLSREVALLRVREARIQKELQESRAQAEAALRENKLVSLRLKTDILRLGTSLQQARSQAATTPRRTTPSRALRQEVEDEADRVELARLAAMRRIAEQRQKERLKATQLQRDRELETRTRFQKRDARIAEFVQRQHMRPQVSSPEPMPTPRVHTPPPPPPPPPRASTPRQAHRPRPSSAGLQEAAEAVEAEEDIRLLYSQEALAAVGLGLSPSHAVGLRPRPARRPSPGQATTVRYTLDVHRAWGLAEMLGGTHAYVVACWGAGCASQATAQSAVVRNTTEPYFGSALVLDERGEGDASRPSVPRDLDDKVLQLRVLNHNGSLADDLLGCAEVSARELLGGGEEDRLAARHRGDLHVVYLYDQSNRTAGCLELRLTRQVLTS